MTAAMQARLSGEGEVAVGTVGVPSQADTVLCGRIVRDGFNGRMKDCSMLLEGLRASGVGATVRLNVAECHRVAAFPGQIVAVLGHSDMIGSTFHVREFLAAYRPLQGYWLRSAHCMHLWSQARSVYVLASTTHRSKASLLLQ